MFYHIFLLSHFTLVAAARNNREVTALLCIDQSAAFNLVKSSIIISKLRIFGVMESALLMIESYLTGRSTVCTVGSATSSPVKLQSGVGEGSVVGPLFFVATLCDVSVVAERSMTRLGRDYGLDVLIRLIAYADDISAVVIGDTEAEVQLAVEVVMEEFLEYFSSAGLSMNPEKSELVVFRRSRQGQELHVGGQSESTKCKLLGVVVEKGYGFESHTIQVAASVKSKVEKLSEVMKLLDYQRRKRITEAIVLSTVTYCLAIWGFRRKGRKRCQKSLNHAVRMILGTDARSSITDGLAYLDWLNMDNLWRLEQISAMRRIISTRVPESVFAIVTGRTGGRYMICSDGLRSSWWPRNCHGENAFVNLAVETYNDLRVSQRIWYNDVERRAMTKSEVRAVLKKDLVNHYQNANLH